MSKDITIFISYRFYEFRELRDKIIKERFSKLDVGLKLNMLDNMTEFLAIAGDKKYNTDTLTVMEDFRKKVKSKLAHIDMLKCETHSPKSKIIEAKLSRTKQPFLT
jgi:hypothetical protein